MAYSRWDRSFWFTYYDGSFDNTRRRDSQLFCIRTMDPNIKVHFSYRDLKYNLGECFRKLHEWLPKATGAQFRELEVYMNWFMYSVEADPSNISGKEHSM